MPALRVHTLLILLQIAQVENEKAQTKVNDAVKLLRRAQHQTEKAGKLIGVFDAPTPPPPLVSQDFPLDQVIARAVDGAVAARLASQTPPPPVAKSERRLREVGS